MSSFLEKDTSKFDDADKALAEQIILFDDLKRVLEAERALFSAQYAALKKELDDLKNTPFAELIRTYATQFGISQHYLVIRVCKTSGQLIRFDIQSLFQTLKDYFRQQI